MKLSLKTINQRRNPESNVKLNSSRLRNPTKIISSKKNSIENSKSLTNSNSKIDIKNHNKSQLSYINTKKLMTIDDIDETNYNTALYLIPEKKLKLKRYYTSNIEKCVETYNEIKKEINQQIFNKKLSNNYTTVQKQNFALVNLLEKLNLVLDTIVERSRYNNNKKKGNPMTESQEIIKNKNNKDNKNKKKISEKEINNNMLKSYIQEYNLLSSKYEKLTNGNYAINLRTNITKSTDEVTKLEKENRELKRTQSRTELVLKHLKTSKDENNYKKKLEEYDKLSNEFESLNKYIHVKESEFLSNERRIQNLGINKNKLIKKAKDEYKIENPEELIIAKKDDKEIEKIQLYIKRKEIENKVLLINNTVKKYGIIEKDNQKFIKELEENISNRMFELKLKKEEIVKLSEILERLDIENNNYIFQTELKKNAVKQNNNLNESNNKNNERYENNNNIQENQDNKEKNDNKEINEIKDDKGNINIEIKKEVKELNKNLKQKNINLSHQEIQLKEINSRYSIKKEKNTSPNNLQTAKTYNKKMILQQLDDQKKREQDSFNRIKLYKKNLKPNFSFSLNNSTKKDNTIEKTEKNVNLSVAVMSNRNKDLEENNDTEEIKEDINITPYDDNKIRPEEEEQRILTNMSQNLDLKKDKKEKEENILKDENIISNDKKEKKITIENSEEKNRQNALNTLPFYELEESEKNIKTENENDNLNDKSNLDDNKDNKEEKKEDVNLEEEKKEEEIIKDEKKEEEILNEEIHNEEKKEGEILSEEKKEEEKIEDEEIKEEEKLNEEKKEEENIIKDEEILNEEIKEEENLNEEKKEEENKEEENLKDEEIKEEEKLNEENKKENENGENQEQNEDNYPEDEIESYYQGEIVDIENIEENK